MASNNMVEKSTMRAVADAIGAPVRLSERGKVSSKMELTWNAPIGQLSITAECKASTFTKQQGFIYIVAGDHVGLLFVYNDPTKVLSLLVVDDSQIKLAGEPALMSDFLHANTTFASVINYIGGAVRATCCYMPSPESKWKVVNLKKEA